MSKIFNPDDHGSDGVCIHCDKTPIKRGLCKTHYSQFNSRLTKIKKTDGSVAAMEWERKKIAENLILKSVQGRKHGVINVFADDPVDAKKTPPVKRIAKKPKK